MVGVPDLLPRLGRLAFHLLARQPAADGSAASPTGNARRSSWISASRSKPRFSIRPSTRSCSMRRSVGDRDLAVSMMIGISLYAALRSSASRKARPSHARHDQVEQNHVWPHLREALEAGDAVGGPVNGEVFAFAQLTDQLWKFTVTNFVMPHHMIDL
jgi:hypothetical protein